MEPNGGVSAYRNYAGYGEAFTKVAAASMPKCLSKAGRRLSPLLDGHEQRNLAVVWGLADSE